MPDAPFLTVVTITLNDKDGLRRTIESLHAQENAPSHEQIVVDGVSDYDVPELLTQLGSKAVLHQGKDKGLYDAMNIGLGKAKGHYVLFLNSGDVLADPGVLAAIAAKAQQGAIDFIYGDSHERQVDGTTIVYKTAQPLKRIAYGMITHHQSMFFRRALLSEAGIDYDLTYKIAADYDFALRFVLASSSQSYLPQPICVFEAGGASFVRSDLGRSEQFQIRRDAYGSWIFAAFVYSAQLVLWQIRSWLPGVYRYLRGNRTQTTEPL